MNLDVGSNWHHNARCSGGAGYKMDRLLILFRWKLTGRDRRRQVYRFTFSMLQIIMVCDHQTISQRGPRKERTSSPLTRGTEKEGKRNGAQGSSSIGMPESIKGKERAITMLWRCVTYEMVSPPRWDRLAADTPLEVTCALHFCTNGSKIMGLGQAQLMTRQSHAKSILTALPPQGKEEHRSMRPLPASMAHAAAQE